MKEKKIMAEIPKTHLNRLSSLQGRISKEILARDKANENIKKLQEEIEEVQYKMFQSVLRDTDLNFTDAMEAIQVLVGEDSQTKSDTKVTPIQNENRNEEHHEVI
jgi:hypothetical protein